jgi:hypothetical protein
MSTDLRRFLLTSALMAALAAAPAAAKGSPAKQLWERLPKICKSLQGQGWGVSADQLKLDPGAKAEMSIPGVLYLCTLAHPLPAKGPGRAPDLGALLTSGAGDPSLILSANVWCAAGRESALDALARELERTLGGAGVHPPAEVLAAIRAGRKHQGSADGLRYTVEPVDVDPDACSRIAPGEFGAVLMNLDVAVEPGS